MQSYDSFDGSALHNKGVKVEEYLPDEGDGKIQVPFQYILMCTFCLRPQIPSTKVDSGLQRRLEEHCSSFSFTMKVWRVEDFELVEVPRKYYGMFFGGDSYVILYTYEQGGREAHIIYFWQVRRAPGSPGSKAQRPGLGFQRNLKRHEFHSFSTIYGVHQMGCACRQSLPESTP